MNARQGEPTVPGGYYTQDDIREIVAYASLRQIEVIPEIEMPAHSNAALAAYPLFCCPVVDKFIGVLPGLGACVRFNPGTSKFPREMKIPKAKPPQMQRQN